MTYILVLLAIGFNSHGVSLDHIEFNSLAACQAAAKEFQTQYRAADTRQPVVFCAAKGEIK